VSATLKSDVPNAFTVTESSIAVGTIVERDRAYFAYRLAGGLIGKYSTQVEAMRAIPPDRMPLDLAEEADVLL
jgi:hypothetical protein